MEDKTIRDEELASQINNRLLRQIEENIKLIDELKSQRDFNNILIQSSPAFFVAIDSNGKLLMMNRSMLNALGYSKSEVLGKDYLSTFVPENEREELYNLFQKLSRFHENTLNENHVLTKDGKALLVEWRGVPVFKGEEFDYFIGIGLDITERKIAENRIKGFNKLFDESLNEIYIFDSNTYKFIYVNKGAQKNIGYSFSELLKLTPYDIRPGLDKKSFEALLEPIITNKRKKIIFETVHERKDGSTYDVEVHLQKTVFDNQKVFFAVALDITARKKAEMELKESQIRLASHLDNTPLACVFWDRNFRVTDWNKSAERIFGYSKYEALGKHANDLIVPDDLKEQVQVLFDDLLTKTGGARGTYENVTKDGNIILCNWYNVAITDSSGSVNGIASLVDDITLRKRNIDKLKQSELKFKLLLENLPNAVFLTKIGGKNAGKIIYANPAAESQTGYKQSELVGMNIINDFLVDESSAELKTQRENDLKNDKILSFVEKKKRADGSVYLTKVMITTIEYENELVTLSVSTDITRLIEAQEKIKESEKKYKSLFENNITAVFVTSTDGQIIECNKAFVEMFGYESKEEILKINSNNLYQSYLGRKLFLKKIMSQKEVSYFEAKGIKKDGTIISTLINATLISDNIIQGTIFDITERKKYQTEISKLSRGIEQSPNMIIFTDVEGNIEYANPRITEVTGYTQKELIGKNPRIFNSGHTPKVVYEELWNTILCGKTWKGEILNKRKNGELFWESLTISPIIDAEGNILNYIGIKDDITEKKKITEELIKAKEKAEEMYRIKSNFLANMSHELRTPLVGILGFSEILEEDTIEPENKKIAELINENGKRLLETLNLILNLSKIESETLEIKLSEFDAIKEVNRSAMFFENNALKKNLSLKVNTNLDKLIIRSDVRLFYEIINNLINNAVKYTDKGGVNITVDVSENYEYVVIKVEDTGIGIPQDKQEIIWKEFRQVSEGINRIYEGTGLGLTIINKYVKELKGKITLTSTLGKGSTFTVFIPTNVRFYSTSDTKSDSSKDEVINADVSSKELPLLLYVEDDAIAVDIVRRFLSNRFNIIVAKDSIEGIVKVRNNKFDIILMDINLKSQLNGSELTKHIRKLNGYNSVPIIAVTAYSLSDKKKEYLGSGFSNFLAKPFSKSELINTLVNSLKPPNNTA